MISEKTLQFLKDLEKNNKKEWFEDNRNRYKQAREEFMVFIDRLADGIHAFDKQIVSAKEHVKIFRINRDLRFTKDKTPYKTNFAAEIRFKLKTHTGPGYYFNLKPGNESGAAGGKYDLDSSQLRAIRDLIVKDYQELEAILEDKNFKKYFNGLSDFGSLKSYPRGYDKDHPAIEYLKMKHFTVWHQIDDKVVTSNKLLDESLGALEQLKKLNDFLLKAL